ncbi:hypothetical protein B0H13DRAFT_1598752, partial [Mycena leptocephala]
LSSGFRSVVATMGTINDQDAPLITKALYDDLFRNADRTSDPPNLNESAEALHFAVKNLRDRGVPFQRWVPFVHYGL